ncbi:MAG TPA: hypothetical protein VNJ08_05925 [Bacteriovoracaceae bacterium]|nr:hypothetical protein [Bacteriovoracaceae bacterium]
MKKVITMILLSLSLSAFAAPDLGPREEHGNPEDEEKCFAEIRGLACGNPEKHSAFIACVDTMIDELSKECQAFHKDEKKRMSGHSH